MTIIYSNPLNRTLLPPLDFDVADPSRVSISHAGLRLTLKPGDIAAGKPRAEAKLLGVFPLGETRYVGLDVRVPTDWIDGNELAYLIQVHDEPPAGVKWKDYASHPPLAAIRYRGGWTDLVGGMDVKRYEGRRTKLFTRGVWTRIVLEFRGSLNDGFARIYANGKLSDGFSRATAWNQTAATLKFGIYMPKGLTSETSIEFKGLVCATTRVECE